MITVLLREADTLVVRDQSLSIRERKKRNRSPFRQNPRKRSYFFNDVRSIRTFRGRKRQYIARTPEELYPDRPDLREHSESFQKDGSLPRI